MVKLSFLGGTGTVTGSCYLLETGNLRILVDCGMFQGKKELRLRNYQSLVDPKTIDYILLTHAHIDHSGLIPRFHKQGFQGKVLATKATVDLCQIMLPDSGHIQELEAEWENRKARRRGDRLREPLYTAQDAQECLKIFEGVQYGQDITLAGNIRSRFLDAGHILGSSIIEIWIKETNREMKIVFSGDLGNKNTPIIRDPAVVNEADYLLIESTYGNRFHEPLANEAQKLKEIIIETVKNKGNIVIPSFAVERTQEILYALNNMFEHRELPPVPVYIDSPLAVSATEIFRNNRDCYDEEALKLLASGDDPFSFPGLTFVREAEESIAINESKGSKIIISSSGMCDAGRIKHHLKHNLWRKECAVVFVGFQAEGTLGRRILDGEKKVKIFGEIINVAAKIYSLPGFSAHADQTGLLSWVSQFTHKPQRAFVVHGEKEASLTLARLIEEKTGISTVIPEIGEEYLLETSGLELARPAVSITKTDKSQELLLSIDRLEKKLSEIKEGLLAMENGETQEETLKKLISEIEERISILEQLAAHNNRA